MFSLDRWEEILDTLRQNKLRTVLTSLSVAWGIFMLVLLLGAGTGLENSVAHKFRDDAVNSIWIRAGQSSLPHQGQAVGRRIVFDNADYEYIKHRVPGVEYITGRFYLRGERLVTYENKTSAFDVRSVHPDHRHLENTIVVRGRFIDDIDLEEKRKVAVIGKPIAAFFFGDGDPLGRWLGISGLPYQVVGVFEDFGADREMQQIYIPITTAQLAYGGHDQIHHLMFTVGDATVAESRAIEESVRELLAARHQFSFKDKRALRVQNNLESFQEIQDVFTGIEIFVWFVGLGTIVAGIVGVSNIMLIAVKERTREIGIRKALGATPANIIGQIVQESVFLTAISGYLGILAGIGVFELVDRYVPDNDYIRDPHVDLRVAVAATALLVVCGALAGYFPARRAAKVDPVVALRDE